MITDKVRPHHLELRTRRPAHMCETCGTARFLTTCHLCVRAGQRTGWLGQRDSNLRIRNRARWAYRYSAVRAIAGGPAMRCGDTCGTSIRPAATLNSAHDNSAALG